MSDFELHAEVRSACGKGAARRLRRDGKIPAILYGAQQEPQTIQFAENHIRKQLSSEAFFSHVLTVKVNGKEERAVIKALLRHPATERILHLDLLRVSETQRITMLVPVHFENEDDSVGRRAGGVVSHHMTEVEISCLPRDLPEYLAIDMTEVAIGDIVHLSEIPLPSGVDVPALLHGPEHDQPVVSIHAARATEIEEEVEAEDEDWPSVEGEVSTDAGEGPDASDDSTGEDG